MSFFNQRLPLRMLKLVLIPALGQVTVLSSMLNPVGVEDVNRPQLFSLDVFQLCF